MAYPRYRARRGPLVFRFAAFFRLSIVLLLLIALVAALVVYLAPLSGAGWTEPLGRLRCATPGLCSDPPGPLAGGGYGSRVEFVSLTQLLECQRSGLTACAALRTGDGVDVPVAINDGVIGPSPAEPDGPLALRSLSIVSADRVAVPGALACLYSSATLPPLDAPAGAPLLFTARLRWSAGDPAISTATPDGRPACVLHLVAGAPPVFRSP